MANEEDDLGLPDPYDDDGSELDQIIAQQEAELEEAQQAEAQRQFEIEEKLLKNKLIAIVRNLHTTRTWLKPDEQKTMKQAKAHPKLKPQISAVKARINANRASNTSKIMSSTPFLQFILYGVLIFFVIICVVAIVGSIMPWLFPDDEDAGLGSEFGISGKDFYGARFVYKDDEQANVSIVEDYVELVESGITAINEINTVTTADGTFNVTLNLNLTIPQDEYFNTFDATAFATEYAELNNIVLEMAKITYETDNGVAYAGSSLVECVGGIKYFGFGASEDMAEIGAILATNLVPTVASATDNNGAVTDTAILSNIQTAVETQVKENKLPAVYNNAKYLVRAEKLFVKDIILSGDEDKLKGIAKENYVAMIFMPKKNVTFTKFSFSIGGADLTNLTLNLTNNGENISISKDDLDFGDEETGNNFIYTTKDNLNVSASVFADIDAENLNALNKEMSLFDIVENVANYSLYLEIKTEENNANINYYTFKENGVVVSLNNTEAFNFSEWETVWETAS